MRSLLLLVAFSSWSISSAWAEPSPASGATRTSSRAVPLGDLAFVIAGGVSLGVYEAGFLYLTTESMKGRPEVRLPLVTGASAGSANALITGMNTCLPPNPEPSKDLGWRTWMPVGYRELFVEDEVEPLAIFSREPLKRAMLKIYERWKAGLPKTCDFVLGVSTTRVKAYPVEVYPGFKVPRQEEKFRFRIRGRGDGKTPSIENYINPHSHVEQVIIPFEEDEDDPAAARRNYRRLTDVLFASGAFPAAFGPQVIVNCLTAPYAERVECAGRPRADLFVDGGVFDNSPLRLADQIAEDGLRRNPDGEGQWRDLGAPEDDRPKQRDLTFVYLDPTGTAYPGFSTDEPFATNPTLLQFAQLLVGEWVTSARSKELFLVTQERPDLGARLRRTRSHYPMPSSHIYAFLGFFEQAFRHFDFYLGMYDAYVAMGRPPPLMPHGSSVGTIADPWLPFACMLGAFERGHEHLKAACDAPGLESFRILVQVSLDRMHDHCRRFPVERLDAYKDQIRCLEAAGGAAPVRILPLPADTEVTKKRNEDQFDYFMRLLGGYHFHFKDLGLTKDEARYGRVKVRRKLLKMTKYLSNAQGTPTERLLLLTAGRSLVNSIEYEPPREWMHVAIGSVVEVGTSFLPFDWLESWARAHVALQLKGISTLVTDDATKLGVVIAAGPEFEPLFLTTPYLQPIVGVRGGYQFGNRDTLGFEDCTEDRALGDQRLCSQVVVQTYLAVTILERLRIQVTGEYFPIRRSFDTRNLDVQLTFGVHFF